MGPGLKRQILRRFPKAPRTLKACSEKRWVLCEKMSAHAPRAIHLEDDLARVTHVMADTTFEREWGRVRGGSVQHAATLAYQVKNVHIYGGALYKGAVRHRLQRKLDISRERFEEVSLAHATVASTFNGSFYFGHWMTEDLTLHLAAEGIGEPLTVARKRYVHEPDYCEIFGIRQKFVGRVKCENLIVLEDHGQNRFKRQRYELLRSRLQRSMAGKGMAKRNSCVFIRRGRGGSARPLVNDRAIEGFLESQGFAIVDPERCTAAQIAEQLVGAELVVGIEGSHLMHGLFAMSPSGTLCVLQPPYRFNNSAKDFTDCLGMNYAFLTGTAVEGGFIVEIHRLERVLDKIAAETRQPAS